MKAARFYLVLIFSFIYLGKLNAQQLFLQPACYDLGVTPRYIISTDFNSDGFADIASADWAGGTASVILGNGDGTFEAPHTYQAGNTPQSLCSGDFNNDGKADLAVACYFSNELVLLWGQGNGQFTPGPSISVPEPFGTLSDDFNQDGKADIAVTLSAELKVAILSGDGAGGFTIQKFNCGGSNWPRVLAKADFDNNGKIDLAVANWHSGLALLKGDGLGGFVVADSIDNGQADIAALYTAVMNNDGKLDLVFKEGSIVSYKYITANLKFDINSPIYGIFFGSGSEITGMCVADFNEDNMLDIACGLSPSDSFSVNIGVPGYVDSFTMEATDYYAQCAHWPFGMLTADFNNDGHADLAASNENSGNVSIFMNKLTAPNAIQQQELELKSGGIVVYPNPASTVIRIKTGWAGKRELYNAAGVLQIATMGDEMDIMQFAKGIYFLKCGTAVKKIVVE